MPVDWLNVARLISPQLPNTATNTQREKRNADQPQADGNRQKIWDLRFQVATQASKIIDVLFVVSRFGTRGIGNRLVSYQAARRDLSARCFCNDAFCYCVEPGARRDLDKNFYRAE